MDQEKTHLYRESYDETWCGIEEVASKGLLYTEKEENVTCLSCLYWRSGGLGVPDKINENKQLPTAEEILKQEVLKVTNGMGYEHNVTHKGIISAMHLYKDLHTACLHEELEKLRAENERLENLIIGYTSSLKDYDVERKYLINENQKLREALDGIIDEVHTTRHDWGENMENIDSIAKEALKGGSDET